MPKIYEYFGLVFLFYANDHTPVHVHAVYGDFANKLEFVYKNGILVGLNVKRATGYKPLPTTQLKYARQFAIKKHSQIRNKWTEFFVLHKKPSFERITQKL